MLPELERAALELEDCTELEIAWLLPLALESEEELNNSLEDSPEELDKTELEIVAELESDELTPRELEESELESRELDNTEEELELLEEPNLK